MNSLLIILGYQISIGILEIIVFQLGAIVLGFFIHFFLVNRKSMPASVAEPSVLAESSIDPDEWRLKYAEEMEVQEKLQQQLRRELAETKENEELLTIELEEVKKEMTAFREQPEKDTRQPVNYLGQLKSAHDSLYEHNQSITRLLEQINVLKDAERKHAEIQETNDTLTLQLRELRKASLEKEATIKQLRQEQFLAGEMKDRLHKTHTEFNALQEKLQKMESYLVQPQHRHFEYDDLQQNYFKLTKDFDEIKLKQLTLLEENQRLSRLMADTEDKLRESNFQRQQLNRKVSFLEELNHDLQQVAEHNKKLEIQLKRLGEIESLLARAADHRKENK